MLISGLQKLTLLDFPGTVSCIVFTHGCNFRCPFCHNSSLVGGPAREEISENEVVDFLKSRKNILDGVVVSGGEPLLHPDIAEFLKKVKELGYKVKIDTNGTKPEMLKKLVNEVGSEKILFGTDFPICNPEMYVRAVDSEEISSKDKDNIYFKNAQRVLGI